jgi:hypothetical protein
MCNAQRPIGSATSELSSSTRMRTGSRALVGQRNSLAGAFERAGGGLERRVAFDGAQQ